MLFGMFIWTILLVLSKNDFLKNLKFLNFFAGPGSWNFSKITRSLYSKYEPKTHRNYPKCCSKRELRLSWWFRVKKFFGKISNFWTLLQVRGHEIFQKSLGPYIQNASLKLTATTQNVVRNVYLDYLIGFEKNNFFGKIWNFWTFSQVRGHEIFQKLLGPYIQNTSLKFTETTQNVVRNVYLEFLIGFEKNNFFGKIWNFWTFLQVRGHEIFQKLLGPYIQNTSLKFTETTQNVVQNGN